MKIMTNLHRDTLFDEIIDEANILRSIYQNTSDKSPVSRSGYDSLKLFADVIVTQLHWLLKNELYYPSFKQFTLFDRKMRMIVSPHIENSIVQRCIYEVIHQDFFKHFSPNSHSCIDGRSILTAGAQVRKRINRIKTKNREMYYLKTDFSNFFGSINASILFDKLKIHIKEPRTLRLLSLYVFFSRASGIPFGNLLSQLFGNFYLTEMDFQLTNYNYTRYADDIIVFGELDEIKSALDLIKQYSIKNCLSFSEARIGKVKAGFKFLGRKHFLDYHLLDRRHINTRAEVYNNLNRYNKSKNKVIINGKEMVIPKNLDKFLNSWNF